MRQGLLAGSMSLAVAASRVTPAPQAATPSPAVTVATSSKGDPAPERVVDLDHGCKLAMDAKLGPEETLARDVEREVGQAVSKAQGLTAANDLTIHIKLSDKSTERFIVPRLGIGGHPIGTDTVSYPEFVEQYEVPWLFGRSGDDPIPKFTGYALGRRIVENYLRAHPDARASTLVQTSAEVIANATPEILDVTH